jgi:HD-GYP domain-containing protein (c-di-GMP phosphodiesterase class II)
MGDSLDLIELPRDKLMVGMALKYTLRDQGGTVLLAKGQKIDTQATLAAIKARGRLFVEIEESDEGIRLMMAGLTEMSRKDAPIKDFSKFLMSGSTQGDDKLTGSLFQRWSDVESKLRGVLASSKGTTEFEPKVQQVYDYVKLLLAEDSAGSQFLLFHRSVTHYGGYSALHSLLCAMLSQLVANVFNLPDAERRALGCAALTMNIGMTSLQDELALQKQAPSPGQRALIDSHAVLGRQMLAQSGVKDVLWLEAVAQHHNTMTGPDKLADWEPVMRITRILQTIDKYTAAMSPRKSRSGRTARDSVRSVVVQADAKHDEVGTSLVSILGLSPPGTYVKLGNGETAVVLKRGLKPAEPIVATVLNKNDEPIAMPRPIDISRGLVPIQATIAATGVRVNLNMETMLKLMPRTT